MHRGVPGCLDEFEEEWTVGVRSEGGCGKVYLRDREGSSNSTTTGFSRFRGSCGSVDRDESRPSWRGTWPYGQEAGGNGTECRRLIEGLVGETGPRVRGL